MASPQGKSSKEPTRTLPERVGQLYYAHGLFCSSHPLPVITFAIAIVLLCCYPLLNLPLPGNVPQQLSGNISVLQGNNSEVGDPQLPRWFTGPPLCYIQQVVLRTTVSPWTEDLVLTDAFRAPLAEVFRLLELIHNYQLENSSMSLSHMCLHIESAKVKFDKKMALPEYSCLALSPANLWQQNREKFQEDSNLLGTIFTYQNLQKGKISLAEILFGMHMKDTGIKRYPLRTRQRVLQYAITLVLQRHDPRFIDGLRQKLVGQYPLHQHHNSQSVSPGDTTSNMTLPVQEILHIYYPGQSILREFVPLTVTYFILFLYMYFSVRKIELVKSKFGMAFSAVVTVLASLSMSIGLCFFFGLTLTLTGKEIFPYLVVIVGLENILVLTKSVVSTPTHLDVKIRVAQGLSREGWSITKNLLIEVTILTVGLFTFVPAIQEFCIFAVVGLFSDFFLQMLFFSTVLAIDIRRMELSSESHHHRIQYIPTQVSASGQTSLSHFRSPFAASRAGCSKSQAQSIVRSKSHPRLNGMISCSYPTNVVAPPNSPPAMAKVPKRLRLVHFWASTRIFQRAFMVCMIVWITVITYSSGVLEHVLQLTAEEGSLPSISERDELIGSGLGEHPETMEHYYDVTTRTRLPLDSVDLKRLDSAVTEESRIVTSASAAEPKRAKAVADRTEVTEEKDAVARLKHMGYEPWRRLSTYHWPAILSLYNVSVSGHYISILPPIRLSHTVSSEEALYLRNPNEKPMQHFQWQALAAALDPLDFSDGGETQKGPVVGITSAGGSVEVPFIPSSPMELFFTAVLCVVSIVVLAYTMVMLYRCVCSRNYAEWRASWAGDREGVTVDGSTQVVMEAVPLILDGHPQEVECLATDGSVVVSSCLGGQLRVWDSVSGEALAVVNRRRYFSAMQRAQDAADLEELPLSDYESGSPPSRGERTAVGDDCNSSPSLPNLKKRSMIWNLPDLRPAININFTGNRPGTCDASNPHRDPSKSGFDFAARFQNLYGEHRTSVNPDVIKDRSWSLTSLEHSQLNKPISHVQNAVSSPTKQTLEDPFSESCHCRLPADICGVTQQWMFHGDVEHCNRNSLGSKCYNKVTRQAQDSVISSCSACSSDILSKKQWDTTLGEIDCAVDSCKLDTASASPVDTGIAGSQVAELERRLSCTCFHSSVPTEVNGQPMRENCGDREVTTDSTLQQTVPILCLDGHENRVAVSCATYHASPVDTAGPQSSVAEVERRLSHTCHCSLPTEVNGQHTRESCGEKGLATDSTVQQMAPIWCLDCHENLIVVGCANGRLEFWEGSTGTFKCLFEDGTGVGITSVKIIGNRVVAAKLSGSVDFLELESYSHGRQMDWGFTAYRRTHMRSGSTGSIPDWETNVNHEDSDEDLHCILLNTTRAHQQPITVLDSEGGRVLTGSKDHTLKVFRLEDQLPLYTLHGHCGPITCLFIDRISPMMSGSGSQDGLLCVWDLLTGACMYSLQAHDGSVTALTYSASYVISLGTDERLCVWERFQGHLLNTIQVSHTYCCSMVMFTHNLLITSKQGSLVVWDVRTGDPVRVVKLGHSDGSVFVKQILLLRDSVACDYSNQLRIVHFPLVTDKSE